MTEPDARRDVLAVLAYVCCLLLSAGVAAIILAVAVRGLADLAARGEDVRLLPAGTFAVALLAIPALTGLLVVRAARGSTGARRAADRLTVATVTFTGGIAVLAIMLNPSYWWLATAPAALGAVNMLLRWTARRLPPAPAEQEPAVVAVRPVAAGDVEGAASGPPYPYPRPLPAAARKAHREAMWSRQMSINVWGFVVLMPGVIATVFSIGWGNGRSSSGERDLWATDPVLAVGLFAGGLLAVAIATIPIVRLARSAGRHQRLLEAYDGRPDRVGRRGPAHRAGDL